MPEQNTPENKMGFVPIPKLLITMSLPLMASMLVLAAYNIVDSMFVAQLNEDALTAVSLVFPIQNLMIAIAAGTGVGINALLSRNLGERRYENANMAAKNGVFLAIASYIIFALAGILGSHLFFVLQTDNKTIITYGTQYMIIITTVSIGIFLQITLERLLQSTGKTIYNMFTQGLGAIINIILDPVLIFGLGPFPRMEVAGAAIATVLGQVVAVLLSLYFNIKKNKEINISMKHFRPNMEIIKNIYKVGLPSIFMQAIGSVMIFGMNRILLTFSTTAAAVCGIYFKLQSFVFMPVFGLTSGMIPIIAFNYGARSKKRITEAIKLSIVYAVCIMLLGLAGFQFFTVQLLDVFDASESMLEIGLPALRTISLSFVSAGFSIVCTAVFQALGKGSYSLIISAIRQLFVILPAAYFLAEVFGLNMIWWAVPIAELFTVFLCIYYLKRIYRIQLMDI